VPVPPAGRRRASRPGPARPAASRPPRAGPRSPAGPRAARRLAGATSLVAKSPGGPGSPPVVLRGGSLAVVPGVGPPARADGPSLPSKSLPPRLVPVPGPWVQILDVARDATWLLYHQRYRVSTA